MQSISTFNVVTLPPRCNRVKLVLLFIAFIDLRKTEDEVL